MPRPDPNALPMTRRVLQILIVLNLLMGMGILALLVASLIAPDLVFRALGVGDAAQNAALVRGMRMMMVLGIAAVPVAHLVLARLLAIVGTVAGGDPFVSENAARLKAIAWAVLGLEVLHLGVGAIWAALSASHVRLDIDWEFSVTPWLAVLLLFVLARVFEQGSRMREDLAGTV